MVEATSAEQRLDFESPEYAANSDALGTLRLLDAIRVLGMEKKTRCYQASSSEFYGNVPAWPQNENTPFAPRNPYAAAKLYAYWITRNYRDAYGMHGPDDYVIATGEQHTVREFVERAFAEVGVHLRREGEGLDEVAVVEKADAARLAAARNGAGETVRDAAAREDAGSETAVAGPSVVEGGSAVLPSRGDPQPFGGCGRGAAGAGMGT